MDNIYYIVHLKDGFKMPLTTIKREFCAKILLARADSIIFELNGSKANIIIPLNAIYWMAPANILWKDR